MYEALVARVRYHIQKANFMGLKEAESTLLLGEAADAIEELSKPCWIPVTERLPEINGFYMCYIKSATLKNTYYRDILIYDNGGFRDHGLYTNRVTHWMPLPEPPKEET